MESAIQMQAKVKEAKMKEAILRLILISSQNMFTSEKAFYKWKMFSFQDKFVVSRLSLLMANSRVTTSKALMVLKKLGGKPPIYKLSELLMKLCRRRLMTSHTQIKSWARHNAILTALNSLVKSVQSHALEKKRKAAYANALKKAGAIIQRILGKSAADCATAMAAIKYLPLLKEVKTKAACQALKKVLSSLEKSRNVDAFRRLAEEGNSFQYFRKLCHMATKITQKTATREALKILQRINERKDRLNTLSETLCQAVLSQDRRSVRRALKLVSQFSSQKSKTAERIVNVQAEKLRKSLRTVAAFCTRAKYKEDSLTKLSGLIANKNKSLCQESLVRLNQISAKKTRGAITSGYLLERKFTQQRVGVVSAMTAVGNKRQACARIGRAVGTMASNRLYWAFSNLKAENLHQVYRQSFGAFWDTQWKERSTKLKVNCLTSGSRTLGLQGRFRVIRGMMKLQTFVSKRMRGYVGLVSVHARKTLLKKAVFFERFSALQTRKCTLESLKKACLTTTSMTSRTAVCYKTSKSSNSSLDNLRYVYCARLHKLVAKMIKKRQALLFASLASEQSMYEPEKTHRSLSTTATRWGGQHTNRSAKFTGFSYTPR